MYKFFQNFLWTLLYTLKYTKVSCTLQHGMRWAFRASLLLACATARGARRCSNSTARCSVRWRARCFSTAGRGSARRFERNTAWAWVVTVTKQATSSAVLASWPSGKAVCEVLDEMARVTLKKRILQAAVTPNCTSSLYSWFVESTPERFRPADHSHVSSAKVFQRARAIKEISLGLMWAWSNYIQ